MPRNPVATDTTNQAKRAFSTKLARETLARVKTTSLRQYKDRADQLVQQLDAELASNPTISEVEANKLFRAVYFIFDLVRFTIEYLNSSTSAPQLTEQLDSLYAGDLEALHELLQTETGEHGRTAPSKGRAVFDELKTALGRPLPPINEATLLNQMQQAYEAQVSCLSVRQYAIFGTSCNPADDIWQVLDKLLEHQDHYGASSYVLSQFKNDITQLLNEPKNKQRQWRLQGKSSFELHVAFGAQAVPLSGFSDDALLTEMKRAYTQQASFFSLRKSDINDATDLAAIETLLNERKGQGGASDHVLMIFGDELARRKQLQQSAAAQRQTPGGQAASIGRTTSP